MRHFPCRAIDVGVKRDDRNATLLHVVHRRDQGIDIVWRDKDAVNTTSGEGVLNIGGLIDRVSLAILDQQANTELSRLVLGMRSHGLEERIRCLRKTDQDRLVLSLC